MKSVIGVRAPPTMNTSDFVISSIPHPDASDSFNRQRHPQSPAGAQRRETPPCVPALQLVQKRDHDARAGAADGMPERDGAAVDVQSFTGNGYVLEHGEDLWSKGFVELDEIEVVDVQSDPSGQLLN